MQETWILSLGREDPEEKEMAIHSSILAWEIPWRKEPGGLQSMRSQKSWTQLSDWTTTTHSLCRVCGHRCGRTHVMLHGELIEKAWKSSFWGICASACMRPSSTVVLQLLWEDKLGVEWSRGKTPRFPPPAKQLCISLSRCLPQPPPPTQAVLGDACPTSDKSSRAKLTSHNPRHRTITIYSHFLSSEMVQVPWKWNTPWNMERTYS